MAEQESGLAQVRISDARTMRALAHPARIEIVEHLTVTGAAMTATECAGLVGLSPSATSYHLRELAKYDLVEQAPSQGDGRERRWRSKAANLMFDADAEHPESFAAERALVELYLARDKDRIREWMERQPQETKQWREASQLMGQQLLVTAEELTQLSDQIRSLLEPYKLRTRQDDAPEDARQVVIQYAAFPVTT
ncbi:DNA-binding transcriptional ArsR family regulator [Actinoplanes lutulentus]|uniref:Helix-turn-helix protein n=1 Tax=Actinoplanes lutulentus TaxID=1287878 RepID=A0A327Z783_9ACTN|nr:helix-turn-helix domain-containing protein [Actinoplanes lutulentus]MBB2945027.1 DNA-binding transcriptional ArsR family regulator [Actinoplanes lutulentus]RAK31822.1 helix-turn-helix protein [Actinoplanes lutulentus]